MGTSNSKPKRKTREQPKIIQTRGKSHKKGKLKSKKQPQGIQIANMKYKFSDFLRLFGLEFVKNNKDKCKMVIHDKEYEIKEEIRKEEFEKFGIKEDEKILEVILKGKGITDMSYMFDYCESLIELDLSSFDTQNVISMEWMFHSCDSLIELDLSSFDTQNVKNMSCMFADCKGLTKLDLSSFYTQNVKDMSCMFADCK